jgi:hypothetical protein
MRKLLTLLLTIGLIASLGITSLANEAIQPISQPLYSLVDQTPEELVDFVNENKMEQGYATYEGKNKSYLLISLGQRNTGGYSLELTNFTIDNGKALFTAKEIIPPSDAFVTQALTYPVLLIELHEEYSSIDVDFVETQKQIDALSLNVIKEYGFQVITRTLGDDGSLKVTIHANEDTDKANLSLLREEYPDIEFTLLETLPDYNEELEFSDYLVKDALESSLQEIVDEYINTRGYTVIEHGDNKYVLVTMGEKRSGGYYLEVENVEKRGSTLTIYVNEVAPDGPAIMVITYPYILLEINTDYNHVRVFDNNNLPYVADVSRPDIVDSELLPIDDTTNTANDLISRHGIEVVSLDNFEYIPLRKTAEKLGFKVSYISSNNTVNINGFENFEISLNQSMLIKPDNSETSMPLYVQNGITMISKNFLDVLTK